MIRVGVNSIKFIEVEKERREEKRRGERQIDVVLEN
jgi:hypothetical protein